MSRKIDTSKRLSKADRKYLQDRGRLPAGVDPVTDEDLMAVNAGETALEDTPDTGDVGTIPPADPDDETEDDEEDEDAEETDYDDMSKAELQAECDERGLPTSGNMTTLRQRLVEDDNSEEE